MPTESSWSRPHIYDTLFEFCKYALFLEMPERGMWLCSRTEAAICSLCWRTSVDRRLGSYQVVWRYGDWWLRGCEEKPQLVRDEVTGQWGASDGFFQDEAVVDGCYGDGGGTHIDDEGCWFARGEAITCQQWCLDTRGGRQTQLGRHSWQARRPDSPSSPWLFLCPFLDLCLRSSRFRS